MKRLSDQSLVLSPSDLMRFQGCAHASALDLAYVNGADLSPAETRDDALLLQNKGHAHERAYLDQLARAGRQIATIGTKQSFRSAADETLEAMRGGAEVIYQGALQFGAWQGYADFLIRVECPSDFGSFGYEAVDTKLKRSLDPKHALQIALYSKGLAILQGGLPAMGHVLLGDGERVSFALNDAIHYAERLAEQLERFVAEPWPTSPEPVTACDLCRWRDHCRQHWEETDSLVAVAGITRSQRQKLSATGITTLKAFATSTGDVPGIHPSVLDRLRLQAQLQDRRRQGGAPEFRLRQLEPGRGLARLPKPADGDLFFDMEGDPLIPGGREYLFGVYHESLGQPDFLSWWAHDDAQERQVTSEILAFFVEHLGRYPGARIYHYNHYEVTALKRLATKYGVGEHHLDHLLRTGAFVDLYRVVHQGLIGSEPGYSIKDLEAFYLEKRQGDVATAVGSIVAYEEWLETGEQKLLDDIEAYNRVDCESTLALRDWLVRDVRPHELPWYEHESSTASAPEEPAERVALRERLNAVRPTMGDRLADLLLELNAFHQRADKPAWWAYFDRQERESSELMDDLESLGGLNAADVASGVERTYKYPPQQTKFRRGSKASVRGVDASVTITELDRDNRRVSLKFPKKIPPPDGLDLIPDKPIDIRTLRSAVAAVTETVIDEGFDDSAIGQYLVRERPRISAHKSGEPIIANEDLLEGTVAAIVGLQDSYLPIQGPPGTGKTFVGARAILRLVEAGHRVAVTSNAHKAIDNLLLEVAAQAKAAGKPVSIAKKVSNKNDGPDNPQIALTTTNGDPVLASADVVGGTAWLFARSDFAGAFSHLVVDEAGQVSLANLLAVSRCARNIVLIGDQMQLPQPIQGVHPGETALSTLEYLLDGERTVAPDKGIFLPLSRRMHPTLCQIVSNLVYDGRLTSHAATERQRITLTSSRPLPSSGLAFIDVEHTANSQESAEEADRLAAVYSDLLAGAFSGQSGHSRPMTKEDILVVSPYNAQVNLLSETLPPGARVGTIDRFQGQEAPACLVSFATSSGAEMPRDVAFLFSLNRLNVALSRAQALAVIFCSPRLLDVPCRDMEQLKLVNGLCAVRAQAGRLVC